MSVQSQIDRLNAIKARIRTNLVAQGITVPADTMLDAMAEQILSVAGQRGTGLLPVTTAPSGYTTAVGGITPKYRMAISTIKTQAGVTEVLLGDTVRYSYYHYPIAYLDASYAYFTTRVSIRGATGDDGKTAYEYATDGGYKGTEEEFAAKLAAETVYVGAEEPTDESVKLWFNPDGAPSTTVQTDWNQTDETAPDFLKNKPFGDEMVEIMPESEVVGEYIDDGYAVSLDLSLFSGNEKKLYVDFDNTQYVCDAVEMTTPFFATVFGNMAFMGGDDTGEPFLVLVSSAMGAAMFIMFDANPHTVGIDALTIQKLPAEYSSAKTIFYINYDDEYIYSDAGYENQVTREDFVNAMAKSSTLFSLYGIAFCPFVWGEDLGDYGCAVVGLYDIATDTVNNKTVYTAEYTP